MKSFPALLAQFLAVVAAALTPLAVNAQDVTLLQHTRHFAGQLACNGADVSVDAMVTTPVGANGADVHKTVSVHLTGDPPTSVTTTHTLTLAEAQAFQQALGGFFAAELRPRPAPSQTYVGSGLPPIMASFTEFTLSVKGLTLSTLDVGGRRHFVVSGSMPPVRADCEAPAAIAQFKLLVDSAVAVLAR